MITALVVEAAIYNFCHVVLIQRTFKQHGSGVFQTALKRGFETVGKK
jgi:hypothetical protein